MGHAPALEEDLGLANIALDLIGQARLLLDLRRRGRGPRPRTKTNSLSCASRASISIATLAEQPNGDFGETIVRQVLIDAFQLELYERLTSIAR